VNLAPVADVNLDPLNPVIGLRAFGADEDVVARHVAAATRGIQSAGVAACAKHFPGHGATRQDSLTTKRLFSTAVGTNSNTSSSRRSAPPSRQVPKPS
jgi:beta-glucosidase-like glycosyl hydrolase